MTVLSREQILAAQLRTAPKTKTVAVPAWGGDVIVKAMTAGDRDAFDAAVFKARQTDAGYRVKVRASIVAFCCVDDAGQRLFSDADIDWLDAQSSDVIDPLFSAATELGALSAAAVEELEKN